MGYRKGYYRKDGTYVQGHYTSKTSLKQKDISKKGCSLLVVATVAIMSVMGCDPDAGCPSKKCSDYSSQTQVQKDFNKNTACLENLDSDKDGIPCENLPNT